MAENTDSDDLAFEQAWAEEAARTDEPPALNAAVEVTDPPADEPAEKKEAAPAPAADPPAATPAPAPQPWEERMNRLERMFQDGFSGFDRQVKEVVGRVGTMQSELARASAARDRVGAENAPTRAQVDAASKSTQAWEQLKSDFPEWGDGVEAYVDQRLASLPQAPAPQDMDVQSRAALKAELRREMQLDAIAERYEDWDIVVKTNDFKSWFATQDDRTRAKGGSERASDVISVLDAYYESKKQVNAPSPAAQEITAQRSTRLSAAAQAGVHVGRGAPPPPKSDDLKTDEEIWAEEAAKRSRRKTA